MHGAVKKRRSGKETLRLVAFVLLGLGAAVFADRMGMPQKWDMAIYWTVMTFGGTVEAFRRQWFLPSFWISLGICFVLHVLAMWMVFTQLLAGSKRVGLVYAIPLAFLEFFLLVGIIPRLELKLFGPRHSRHAR